MRQVTDAKSMPRQFLRMRQPMVARFIVRQYSFGYRIVEIVGVYRNETLTIEWGGLYHSELSAVSHIETELGISVRRVSNGYVYLPESE